MTMLSILAFFLTSFLQADDGVTDQDIDQVTNVIWQSKSAAIKEAEKNLASCSRVFVDESLTNPYEFGVDEKKRPILTVRIRKDAETLKKQFRKEVADLKASLSGPEIELPKRRLNEISKGSVCIIETVVGDSNNLRINRGTVQAGSADAYAMILDRERNSQPVEFKVSAVQLKEGKHEGNYSKYRIRFNGTDVTLGKPFVISGPVRVIEAEEDLIELHLLSEDEHKQLVEGVVKNLAKRSATKSKSK